MLTFLSTITAKDVILYLGGIIITLLLYIYRKDQKKIQDDVVQVNLAVKDIKQDCEVKRNLMQKAFDLRVDDVYFELEKYEEMAVTVTENKKDIEWLKKQ